MIERGAFERSLAEWMADETSAGMPERAVREIIDATSPVRPTRHWLARLRMPAFRVDRRVAVGTSRRRLALVGVVALLLLTLLTALAGGWRPFEPPGSADWNGYRSGPSRASTGGSGPIGRPVLKWRFTAGDAVKDAIAVVDDLVIAPSQDGILHAIGLSDGVERWRFEPGTSVTAPYVDRGLVFVTDGRGFVNALDLETGAELWRSIEIIGSATSPTVGDGAVLVGTGDGELIALETRTGVLRWRVRVSSAALRDPSYADGTVFATTADGVIAAIRSADGTRIWDVSVDPDPLGTPTISDGVVYIGSRSDEPGGRLRALDAATGTILWQTDEPWFAPSLSNGFAISARDDGVMARDAGTGAERWRYTTGSPTRGPAIVGSTVFLGTDLAHRVEAIDFATGRPLWQFDVDGANQCCIAVAKGFVVVGTMAGSVYVIGGDGSTLTPRPDGFSTPSIVPSSQPPSASTPPPTPAPSQALPDALTVVARHEATDLGLDRPIALAIGPSGDVYITDQSMEVTQLTPDGQVVRRWGGPGAGDGEFDFLPAGINTNIQGSIGVGPDGKVYVSDSDNHRIQAFTADGRFLRAFGSQGTDPGQFTLPFDVSADDGGNVYVTDDGLLGLTKFSKAGEPVWVVDGSTDPRLDGHMHDADIDASGRIVVINDDRGIVSLISPSGEVVDSFEAQGCDVTVDAAGRFYVTTCDYETITVFDAGHRAIAATISSGLKSLQFGPNGEAFALDRTGAVVRLALEIPR